jgi:hypothetical protein
MTETQTYVMYWILVVDEAWQSSSPEEIAELTAQGFPPIIKITQC